MTIHGSPMLYPLPAVDPLPQLSALKPPKTAEITFWFAMLGDCHLTEVAEPCRVLLFRSEEAALAAAAETWGDNDYNYAVEAIEFAQTANSDELSSTPVKVADCIISDN